MSIKTEYYDFCDETAVKAFFAQYFTHRPYINFPERLLNDYVPSIRRAIVVSSQENDVMMLLQKLQDELPPLPWRGLMEISFDHHSPSSGNAFLLFLEEVGKLGEWCDFYGMGHRECSDFTITYFRGE